MTCCELTILLDPFGMSGICFTWISLPSSEAYSNAYHARSYFAWRWLQSPGQVMVGIGARETLTFLHQEASFSFGLWSAALVISIAQCFSLKEEERHTTNTRIRGCSGVVCSRIRDGFWRKRERERERDSRFKGDDGVQLLVALFSNSDCSCKNRGCKHSYDVGRSISACNRKIWSISATRQQWFVARWSPHR